MSRGYPYVGILKNGTATSFNVDGSVTPVEFSFEPLPGDIFSVYEIKLILSTQNKVDNLATEFMNIPSLTNGIDVEVRISDGNYQSPGALKNNMDILSFFNSTYTEDLIGTFKIFDCKFPVSPPMVLDGSRGDFYKIRIRDNLTALRESRATLIGKLYRG